jgi:predicted AlkP superfamily pyrophosphatase or phosphodiesterase
MIFIRQQPYLYQMKNIVSSLFLLLSCCVLQAQPDTTQQITAGRTNSAEQQKKPYVILVSADGFRYDYAKKYNAVNLLQLSGGGVSAVSMIPSYPSLTFPNHYTLVTGMYPSHHGIVDNNFYDRNRNELYSMRNRTAVTDSSWYGGTPLWVLAEQQQMVTASFYWVGSEAAIQGVHPTYYYVYNELIPIDQRVATVKNWLQLPEETRPHLILFYFSEVDHEGHYFGPDSRQTMDAVHTLDSSIKKLTDAVRSTGLPVNFVFVSDHGMTNVDTAHKVIMPAVDESKFVASKGGELSHLYAKNSNDIAAAYALLKKEQNGFTTYLKDELPAYLSYGTKDDRLKRIGDIVLVPDWPRAFGTPDRKQNPGAHGFDPNIIKDMHASFYCWGPAFKKHKKIGSFKNVDVYPVVADILGLPVPAGIDGTNNISLQIRR